MTLYTTFKVHDQLFGIEVLLVREINQQMDITYVQKAPEYIRGLINLRGQIVTIFDLSYRLVSRHLQYYRERSQYHSEIGRRTGTDPCTGKPRRSILRMGNGRIARRFHRRCDRSRFHPHSTTTRQHQ